MFEAFSNRMAGAGSACFFHDEKSGQHAPEASLLYFSFHRTSPPNATAYITAQRMPRNKTLLVVSVRDEDWQVIQPCWEALLGRMVDQGWVSARDVDLPSEQGGRPTNKIDAWAWDQLHVLHRPRQIVREEWREKNTQAGRVLKDEPRSWRHAIMKNKR